MKFHQTKAELDRDIAAMTKRQLYVYGLSCLIGEVLLVVFMVMTAWRWFGWWAWCRLPRCFLCCGTFPLKGLNVEI